MGVISGAFEWLLNQLYNLFVWALKWLLEKGKDGIESIVGDLDWLPTDTLIPENLIGSLEMINYWFPIGEVVRFVPLLLLLELVVLVGRVSRGVIIRWFT